MSTNLDVSDPRGVARAAIRKSIPANIWEQNSLFVDKMIAKVKAHKIFAHPIIDDFNNKPVTIETSRVLHMEFGYGFAQIFVDSLMHAMARCTTMEELYGAEAKVSARFLLQLNVLDELGFVPSETPESYSGNPYASHYLQFNYLCDKLGADLAYRNKYKHSDIAEKSRRTFTDFYNDYVLAIAVLAAAEQVFSNYAGPWATNVAKSTGMDTSEGYHNIHVEDDHGHSLDDDHSEDSWTLLRQAAIPARYEEIERKLGEWLDTWAHFGDNMQKILRAGAR